MVKNGSTSLNTENTSMRFDAYEAEDFLQEQSFLNYCIAANEDDVQFWNTWVNQHPDREPKVEQAKQLYYLLNGNITSKQFTADEQSFIAAFEQHTGSPLIAEPKRRSIRMWWYAAAAAVLVAVSLIVYNFNTPRSTDAQVHQIAYSAPKASVEKKPLVLPDGSKVTLNSGSIIRLADNFNGNSRELTLEGEGYFDVAHDAGKPFIIHTKAMDVKVLGTRFNVKAYPGDRESETSLISGSVEITVQRNNQKIILTPNHKVVLSNDSDPSPSKSSDAFHMETLNANGQETAELSWTQNKLVFRDNRLEDISRELERWYDVQLIFEDEAVRKFRYSATFENKNIDEVLAALRLSRPFNIRKEKSNVIRISSQQ